MDKLELIGLTEAEVIAFLQSIGAEKYRARQILEWIYARGAVSFDEMTNLSKPLRDKLGQYAQISSLRIRTKQVSQKDGTTKYLLELADGHRVECVLLPHDYGNSVCVSTQVGCAMGCRFCASTLEGLVRNLSAGEIMGQVLTIQAELLPQGKRVSSVVIMGSGEPLANYEPTLQFIRLLHLPYGLNIGYRNITLSTSGIVPGIDRLAEENLPMTLSISLHASNDALRSELMPINTNYPIVELLAACDRYVEKSNRRVTYEYSLIAGVNDQESHARELAGLLAKRLAHVNLIPINAVAERGYLPPARDQIKRFQEILQKRGIETTIRKEMGGDIDAACGQLRRRIGEQ